MKDFLNVAESEQAKQALEHSVEKSARLREQLKTNRVLLRIDVEPDYSTKITKRRILQIREHYGIQRTIIAKILHTSYRQYLRFEEENGVIPSWVLCTLSMFYNLSLDFVAGISDDATVLYQGEYQNVNGCSLPDAIILSK